VRAFKVASCEVSVKVTSADFISHIAKSHRFGGSKIEIVQE
jgi:hypothetical protein